MNNFKYRKALHESEAHLAEWVHISFVSLTVSLLFYRMARIEVTTMIGGKKAMGLFTIALICVSVAYTVVALTTYLAELNNLFLMCKQDKECNEPHVKKMYKNRNIFFSLCVITVIIELGIAFIIAFSIF